jgi:S1-C subfamily serine protease
VAAPSGTGPGRVIGVAFEVLSDADNVGYIIPVPIVRHFLQDLQRHGR